MIGKKENETSRILRFVTAASLFDGHDAAINVIRRLIQSKGAEVVHLGHNRSVCEVVRAAIQEDVDAIAISSYQGGHIEYFTYLLDLLKEYGAEHIKVFGGGGGTITLEEINFLESAGVSRIYHPEQGMKMGLIGMIDDLFQIVRGDSTNKRTKSFADDYYEKYVKQDINNEMKISQTISAIENRVIPTDILNELKTKWKESICDTPVIGITGTGGAGKSSVVDELLERFLRNRPDIRIAVLAVDPTRRKTGGALLGDRIRMNSLSSPKIFMRSMATRRQHLATNEVLEDISIYLRSVGYDLILIETAGIGQSDSQIVDFVDLSIYIMTGDYGAATQLEKIDMVDYADIVILNKYEKRGSADALRDIRKQWRRNHNKFDLLDTEIPIYPAIANQFNDPGLSYAFYNLCRLIARKKKLDKKVWVPKKDSTFIHSKSVALIPENRVRYLSDISENGRQICIKNKAQSELASEAYQAYSILKKLKDEMLPSPLEKYSESQLIQKNSDKTLIKLRATYQYAITKMTMDSKKIIHEWTERKSAVESDKYSYSVRGKDIKGDNYTTSLSQLKIPKVAAPQYRDWGEILKFLLSENLPGNYPYTAGVFSYRRIGEDPSRMFAGEGTPEKTNRRFHYVSSGLPAIRLSTAFDSVTLYGADPDVRPDIWGKIGNSGVSIATLDDMKKLYSGFDLCSSKTSVSMTINGPAPMILAFFMNAVIDQQVEIYLKENDLWAEAELKIQNFFKGKKRPTYKGKLPDGHNQLGLALLGITGDRLVDGKIYSKIKEVALTSVRGTVQADILKEDQAQNTCIFSTNFAMRMMGDVQEYFIKNKISNYYSVSVSGYHIAEAGANPISQLAFTLSNGFTLVEYYLSRGMKIDDFVSNFSFFFSNGMDPEYAVMGRVARRIWARAMKERYEAITTPTSESVRRAMAIQLIINREFGLNFCENPWQGSFVVEQLTDLLEEAVYDEFDRISERGGVLGAMETMYQRGKIQEESMVYEHKKYDGSLPLIGINTFLPNEEEKEIIEGRELARSDDKEKQLQVNALKAYVILNKDAAEESIANLKLAALNQENTFSCLMEAAKFNSLGQLSSALYEIGGLYRRNM